MRGESRLYQTKDLLPFYERHIKNCSQCFPGDVVVSRTQSTGHHNQIRILETALNRQSQPFPIVTNNGLTLNLNRQVIQAGSKKQRVRVSTVRG
jgi:hypothetical protein